MTRPSLVLSSTDPSCAEIDARLGGQYTRSHAAKVLDDHRCLCCRVAFPSKTALRKHLMANRKHTKMSRKLREKCKATLDEFEHLGLLDENALLSDAQRDALCRCLYDLAQFEVIMSFRKQPVFV